MVYLHGCNYPWSTDGTTIFYGLDFGANVWGSHLGVSTRRAAVTGDFAEMAALGFTVARWFVFCDGRAGIVYDDRAFPVGTDAHLFDDLDAGLEAAAASGMRVDFVLLDHHWMFSGLTHTVVDQATGALYDARLPDGRANILLSPAGRDALIDRVIAPVVRRYGPGGVRADLGSAIAAYEFMNEPDFVVEEWEGDLSSRVRRPLPFEVLGELVSRVSTLVHTTHPGVLMTLGCARAHNLWAWDDETFGLDVLQVHTYPDVRRPREEDIFGTHASELGVRRPVIIGEFPCSGPAQHPEGAEPPDTTLDDYLEFAIGAGYLGGWPWSFSGTDAYGRMPVDPLRRFAERHPELVNRRAQT